MPDNSLNIAENHLCAYARVSDDDDGKPHLFCFCLLSYQEGTH